MPPRHEELSPTTRTSENNSDNKVTATPSTNQAGLQQRPLPATTSLRTLALRNSIATFDPVRIYSDDHAADGRILEEGSAICAWLTGRSVLVSGASGFIGKVLVEKLMRACAGLHHVFVLVREKRGKCIAQRLEEIYDDVIFKKLLRLQPKFRGKIFGINGDISLPNLGISIEDRKMITDHVSIIFHVAATVNFDEKLKVAVDVNVKGSAQMLQLGRECGERLSSYVHVSSTYANCTRTSVTERVYEPPIAPSQLITLTDRVLDAAHLEQAKAKILGDYPNTYSFTKCVGEKIVEEQSEGMPVCIFRPAIVISTYREPLRGWTDNMYGPTGVFTGVGMGIIRTLHCDPDKVADMVPADMVVNCIIAAAYNNWKDRSERNRVYNYVSSAQKPIRWSEICAFVQYYGFETPTMRAMWYFCFRLNKHRLLNWLCQIFLHWLPALLIDGACICANRKPKMVRLYRKIHKFLHVISYFSVKEWRFSNDNVRKLWDGLGQADRVAFPFCMDQLDWDTHSQTHALGLRTYLLKEDIATLPAARNRWKRLYYLHRLVQIITGLLLLNISYAVLNFVMIYFSVAFCF